jgi:hypothetical protein
MSSTVPVPLGSSFFPQNHSSVQSPPSPSSTIQIGAGRTQNAASAVLSKSTSPSSSPTVTMVARSSIPPSDTHDGAEAPSKMFKEIASKPTGRQVNRLRLRAGGDFKDVARILNLTDKCKATLHTLDKLLQSDDPTVGELTSSLIDQIETLEKLSANVGEATTKRQIGDIEKTISGLVEKAILVKVSHDIKNGNPIDSSTDTVVYYDERTASGMFTIDHAVVDIENSFKAFEKKYCGDQKTGPELKQKLDQLKSTCIEKLEEIKVPSLTVPISKADALKLKEKLAEVNKVKAQFFVEVAKLTGGTSKVLAKQVKELEKTVNEFNSQSIGKKTVVTVSNLGGEIYVSIGQPQRETMHTSADRNEQDISNFYSRSTFKLKGDNFEKMNSVQTHSSLAPITIGKMKSNLETTHDRQRICAGLKHFRQALVGFESAKNKDGALEKDAQGNEIIRMVSVTLFTPAKSWLDKRTRGMESEHLMLEETALIYNLHDNQVVELEDGRKVRVIVEHINGGSNIWATRRALLDTDAEKSVNDKGMVKISEGVEELIGVNPRIPAALQKDKMICENNIRDLKKSTEPRLNFLRKAMESSEGHVEFGKHKKEVMALNQKMNAAYSELAKVRQKIFKATLDNEKINIERLKVVASRIQESIDKFKAEDKTEPRIQKEKEMLKLKLKINALRLHLEVQDLYYNDKFRSVETIHNLQTAVVLLGKLRGTNVKINCKSAVDRTTVMCNAIDLAFMTYEKTGEFPSLSDIIAGDPGANEMFNDPEIQRDMHLHGVGAKIAGQNKPGAPFLQVTTDANPKLGRMASLLAKAGEIKKPWKNAVKLAEKQAKEGSTIFNFESSVFSRKSKSKVEQSQLSGVGSELFADSEEDYSINDLDTEEMQQELQELGNQETVELGEDFINQRNNVEWE